MIKRIAVNSWHDPVELALREQAIDALESGQVVLLENLPFPLLEDEKTFLTPNIVAPGSKNIRFNLRTNEFGGCSLPTAEQDRLQFMLQRYATDSRHLVEKLLPHYQSQLTMARTSYRPVEIAGRPTSYRKDDTRLHVDAFPSTPTAGKRILRVFTNINPDGVPRHWRVGEPFPKVVAQFLPKLPKPNRLAAKIMNILKITRGERTPYDHYMHHLHNAMKKDQHYQANAEQEACYFYPGMTWLVYTDQTSHAAMSGQYVLEQTFYLPVHAMRNEQKTPLRVLENALAKKLVL